MFDCPKKCPGFRRETPVAAGGGLAGGGQAKKTGLTPVGVTFSASSTMFSLLLVRLYFLGPAAAKTAMRKEGVDDPAAAALASPEATKTSFSRFFD